jgi:hypothetical protein
MLSGDQAAIEDDAEKTLAHRLTELFRVEIEQPPVEKQFLPETLFQMEQSFGPAGGLFDAPCPGIKTIENSLSNHAAGTGDQHVVTKIGRHWKSRHVYDSSR